VTIKIFGFLFIVLGAAVAIPAVLGLVGIGLMRHAPDVLVAVGAVALVAIPARGLRWTAKEAKRPSAVATGVAMMGWSLVVLICMPL
jgi:hypothetical protein